MRARVRGRARRREHHRRLQAAGLHQQLAKRGQVVGRVVGPVPSRITTSSGATSGTSRPRTSASRSSSCSSRGPISGSSSVELARPARESDLERWSTACAGATCPTPTAASSAKAASSRHGGGAAAASWSVRVQARRDACARIAGDGDDLDLGEVDHHRLAAQRPAPLIGAGSASCMTVQRGVGSAPRSSSTSRVEQHVAAGAEPHCRKSRWSGLRSHTFFALDQQRPQPSPGY